MDEKLCAAKQEVLITRMDAMDAAQVLLSKEMERRLEGLNDLRVEVVRDRDQFLRQEVYAVKTQWYDEWVRSMESRVTRMETRYASRVTFATLLSVFSALIALLAVLVPWLTLHGK